MTKDEVLAILNNNLKGFSREPSVMFIVNYLVDNGIKDEIKIQTFISLIANNAINFINGSILQECLIHSIKYYLNKYSIISVQKDNITILYY